MPKVKQKYLKKNLVFLCYDRGIKITRTVPEGVILDLKQGTWSFPEDTHFGNRLFEIGTETRYVADNHKWGVIGVYDMTRFRHIELLIFEVEKLSRCRCDN